MEALFEDINTLLAEPADHDLDEIERRLTDGYAQALSLEAERWRLSKRISEVASTIGAGDTARKSRELAALSEQLESSEGMLARLRALLGDLRRHADATRAAAPAANRL